MSSTPLSAVHWQCTRKVAYWDKRAAKAARDDLDRALELWAGHYGDTERARYTLQVRGLL